MTQSTTSSAASTPQTPRTAEERLMVAVRIRPLRPGEGTRILSTLGAKTVIVEDDGGDKGDVLRQKRTGGDRRYAYDSVFGEEASQEAVYEATTRGLVKDVLGGYNATVFAYGATGAGKTHTMVGNPRQPGVMVRALNDLFQAVSEAPHPERYQVTMSYLEIYNENIRDLLNPSSGFLELREDSRGRNIQVARLTEISTTSTEEVMNLLQQGNRARTVESTAANRTSSRSHALLSVTVRQTLQTPNQTRMRVKQGRLFMIDLAGSERAANTKNQGKRLQEGAHINRSLLALGNCITALCGGARYVNYRDSKLTRLLKEALSGNCRTVMVAHVSPAAKHRDESRQTLLYAERANNISNKVERNVLDVSYHVDQYRTVISELREEIDRLRGKMSEPTPPRQLPNNNNHNPAAVAAPSSHVQRRVGQQVKRLREQIVNTFKEQMRLRRKLMEVDGQLLSLGAEADRQHSLISQWESRNNKLYKNKSNTATRWQQRRGHPEDSDHDKEWSDADSTDGDLQRAWVELASIEREQERQSELRESIERELEDCRQRGAALEEEMPKQISSDEEKELLALMCRCHELEVEKMALQSERIIKQHELRRRDLVIMRYDRQRQLCETIITRQRELMEEGCVTLPPDLQELYRLYQQEILAATYTDVTTASYQAATPFKGKLPPISQSVEPLFQRSMRVIAQETALGLVDTDMRTVSSAETSDGSDASPFPPITGAEIERMVHSPSLPPPAILFPPISDPRAPRHQLSPRLVSRLPVPMNRHSPISPESGRTNMRRVASDDNIASTPDKHMRSHYRWPR